MLSDAAVASALIRSPCCRRAARVCDGRIERPYGDVHDEEMSSAAFAQPIQAHVSELDKSHEKLKGSVYSGEGEPERESQSPFEPVRADWQA